MDPQLSAFIRNAMITAGGAVATKYGLDQSFVPTAVGILMTGVGFAWSSWGHTKTSTIAAAAALHDVHAVITTTPIATTGKFKTNPKVISDAARRP